MSKVLLLNPPAQKLYLRDQHSSSESKSDYYWPPVDLLVLSGILSQEHEVSVIDAIVEHLSDDACLKQIVEYKPDAIVFLTGIVSWISDFSFMEKVYDSCKGKMIASGGFLRSDYQRVMDRYSFLDAIIMDFSSPSILDYLKGNYDALNYMCIRQDHKIVLTPEIPMKQFTIPVPRHELFKLEKYRIPHGKLRPFTSVLTNYGCPFACSYCPAEHTNFKYRPVENIIPEIEKLVSIGVKEIFFKDFTFGFPREAGVSLCQAILERFPKLSWICSSRVDVLDEELLILMKKAGCHTIQFGVESGSQELLDTYNKKITLEKIISTFAICKKIGIRTLGHFIIGLPGETEQSAMKTIALAKKIKCGFASFNIITPTYGTTLRAKCIENNWLVGENEEFDSSNGFPVVETPQLSRENLWRLRSKAVKSFYLRPSFVFEKLIGVRKPSDLYLLTVEGISLIGNLIKGI